MRLVLAMLAFGLLGLGGVVAFASGSDSASSAKATAAVASGSVGTRIEAHSTGTGSQHQAGAVDTAALRVRDGEASVRTNAGSEASAHSVAVARSVDALDGLVTAYGVRREVAAGDGRHYEGQVRGLRIDGEMIGDVSGAQRFELPDGAGVVDVNVRDAGMRIVLYKAAGGQPAGTDLKIAVVHASARRPAEPEASPEPTATPERKARKAKAKKPARRAKKKPRRSVPAPSRLTDGGYAFPVYGQSVSVADDFGGPRQIGPHQGNDIFAPFGSPVLAVADGVLKKVGTLPISGNRLWLETDSGDAFFYAHLSSFSELAESGRRVEAGDVLGFVGNTGDAEPTPPHVHFEIHPRGIEGPAADPHQVLLTWQRRHDVAPSAWLRRIGADTTERPGALVEVRDFIAGE